MYKLVFGSEKEVDDVVFQDQYVNETCEKRSREKREEDEDVSGVNRMGRGPCVVGGDAYVPPTLTRSTSCNRLSRWAGKSHLTPTMSDNRGEDRKTFFIPLIIFYLLLHTLLPHPFHS